MLTILLGDYGSGKTGVAKMLARKNGGVYLDTDEIRTITRLKEAVTSMPADYYLDGLSGPYCYSNVSEYLGLPVHYIVCMAAPDRIEKVQKERAGAVNDRLPHSWPDIVLTTRHCASIALSYDAETQFVDTSKHPAEFVSKARQ